MLVLSRRRNERVVITTRAGERIVVDVCEIRPDKVRLGFDADPRVAVNREEVEERIEEAKRRARP